MGPTAVSINLIICTLSGTFKAVKVSCGLVGIRVHLKFNITPLKMCWYTNLAHVNPICFIALPVPVIWGVYWFFGIWQLMCVLGICFMHSLLGGVSVHTIYVSTQMLFAHLWFPSPSSHFQLQPSRQETPLCTTSSGSPMRNLIKYKINSKYILNTVIVITK